jgi:hypothetical protein
MLVRGAPSFEVSEVINVLNLESAKGFTLVPT